jgi:hypothetical protein
MYHDTIDNQDCEGITQAMHHFETRSKLKCTPTSKESLTQLRHCITTCHHALLFK